MDRELFATKITKNLIILLGIVLLFFGYFFISSHYADTYLTMTMGPSMQPTFSTKSVVTASRISSIEDLNRMDIVLAVVDGERICKRVVGLPGDTIQVIDNQLYVNNELVEESYVEKNELSMIYTNDDSWTLQEDEVFLLGDNRDNSLDSRTFGAVSVNCITSVVIFHHGLPDIY